MRNFIPVSTLVVLSGTLMQMGVSGCESSRTTSQFGPMSQGAGTNGQLEQPQDGSLTPGQDSTAIAQPTSGPTFEQAFDAARKVLSSHGFELERVDAVNGVISTAPKSSAGLATPWDLDQTTFKQEMDDFLNYQERRVRIEFARDAHLPDSKWVGNVTVNMYRHQTPGSRVPSKSATLWTATRDPLKDQQGLGLYYKVPTKRDTKLERRLAEEIETSLLAVGSGDRKTAAK